MSLRIIAGKFKGQTLFTPKGVRTRPTQGMLREAFFNICQHFIDKSRFLDLFAGSGAMGFEALSRGAAHVSFIEKDRNACFCIRKNIASLQVEGQTCLYLCDYRAGLEKLSKKQQLFDIVYLDPPYDHSLEPILNALLENTILKKTTLIFVEQKYSTNPYLCKQLICSDSRRFGDSLLQKYELS